MISVDVPLGERGYQVLVGFGVRHDLADLIPPTATRAAVVTQDGIDMRLDLGVEQRSFLIPDGEEAKTMATVEDLCRSFARFGLTRSDVVVAVGGGVVTDAAGFAAAVYHRGVGIINVATTLLGMVDAAIGGKTGVNLPEGKNLVGAFWQPLAVLCDLGALNTLPTVELRSGYGEMAKYQFLGVDADLRSLPPDEQVAACVRCKVDHVAGDEHDSSGRRALLNYGHTLAHAIETAGSFDFRHGEAVAVGLAFAARLARRLGRIGDDRVAEHDEILEAFGLPSRLPAAYDTEELVALMARDKKAEHGAREGAAAGTPPGERGASPLTFVLDGPDGVAVVTGVERAAVEATLEEVRAT